MRISSDSSIVFSRSQRRIALLSCSARGGLSASDRVAGTSGFLPRRPCRPRGFGGASLGAESIKNKFVNIAIYWRLMIELYRWGDSSSFLPNGAWRMLPDPSTSPAGGRGDPGDGQEPDDYPPPEWPEPDLPGTGQPGAVYPDAGTQGLFLSVPAGAFDADRLPQAGPAAEMPPDPLLATIIDAVTGPAGPGVGTLSDDQLIGVIAAVRRLESRIAWYALTAVAEFAARWGGEVAGAEFAADQLACELHLTSRSAAVQLDYAAAVTGRLPRCLAALFAGLLHPVQLRIIEEETQILSAEDAATADAALAETAGALTFGKLRSAAHRMVLDLDPEAAARRKEAGRRDAHVQPFREPSGNAGMIARELPSREVLASWQHVEQRALDLRAAGIPGTVEELRVRAYLDLLQERHTRLPVPGPSPAGTPATAGPDDTGPGGNDDDGQGGNGPCRGPGGRGPAGGPDGNGSGGRPGADTGARLD